MSASCISKILQGFAIYGHPLIEDRIGSRPTSKQGHDYNGS